MASQDFDRARHATVAIAIICMIAETELRAIIEVLKSVGAVEIELTDAGSGEYFYEVETRGGMKLRLVVACCERQGNLEAAITTQVVLVRHNPRFAFLCGIGGGMRIDKAGLGDVVIAPEVTYRRYTKVLDDGTFGPESFNVPASPGGRVLAQRFLASHPNPKKVQSPLNDGDLFAIHDEKILSWDLVLDDRKTKHTLLTQVDRQLTVVEMEGAGFLMAVASHAKHMIARPWRPASAGGADALIVRGISDPASEKAATDKAPGNWRRVAARNAAQTVLMILDTLKDRDFAV